MFTSVKNYEKFLQETFDLTKLKIFLTLARILKKCLHTGCVLMLETCEEIMKTWEQTITY